MARDLSAMAESLRTEADFLHFLRVLLDDWKNEEEQLTAQPGPRYEPGLNGWKNGSIGGFLAGMLRWAIDANYTQRYDTPPDWSYFAFLLLAGKVYK